MPLPRPASPFTRPLRHAALALVVLASAACRHRTADVGRPVPALRAALADTDPARRVYVGNEVARSAILADRAQSVFSKTDGEARARVVVGANGRVEPSLIEILPGSDADQAARLLTAVPQWRFRPAERRGRVKVRQLVLVTVRTRERHTTVDLQPAPRPEG